jgi:hypothetical protein
MSIVLVIVGLLVGGVLAGHDLIDAAAQRAQIAQINRYNTDVHIFDLQYNYLPGDIKDPYATQYGFQPRGTASGQGDGNGVLEANCDSSPGGNYGFYVGCGELATFWVDLSTAKLIDSGIFYKGVGYPNPITPSYTDMTTTPTLTGWLPTAKLGSNMFVYVFSLQSTNYFAVSTATALAWNLIGGSSPGFTVQQAANIDKKIDDGLPQSGSVIACYINYNAASGLAVWAAGGSQQGASGGINCVPTTAATPYAVTNCYDNNGVAGPQRYSLVQNAGLQNCALSFQFQ